MLCTFHKDPFISDCKTLWLSNCQEFYLEFKASKSEYDAYQNSISKWEGGLTGEQKHVSITEQLKSYQEQVKERESNKEYKVVQAKDRGGR